MNGKAWKPLAIWGGGLIIVSSVIGCMGTDSPTAATFSPNSNAASTSALMVADTTRAHHNMDSIFTDSRHFLDSVLVQGHHGMDSVGMKCDTDSAWAAHTGKLDSALSKIHHDIDSTDTAFKLDSAWAKSRHDFDSAAARSMMDSVLVHWKVKLDSVWASHPDSAWTTHPDSMWTNVNLDSIWANAAKIRDSIEAKYKADSTLDTLRFGMGMGGGFPPPFHR